MVEEKGGGEDSGMGSAASTPEAATPAEERSATPSAQTNPTPPDTTYTIKILPPGSEPFDLQVTLSALSLLHLPYPVSSTAFHRQLSSTEVLGLCWWSLWMFG